VSIHTGVSYISFIWFLSVGGPERAKTCGI
jgi:hypothetical protein